MAVIDDLDQIAKTVDDRKSYAKFVIAVFKAHHLTMGSMAIRMGYSRMYLGHTIHYAPLLRVAIVIYRVALFINVPPRELLYPLNSGLNMHVPYTYQGWKKQFINKVHDRKTLLYSLHGLLWLNSYNVSRAMRELGHPSNFLSLAIRYDGKTTISSDIHELAPLLNLTDDDCVELVNNSGAKDTHRIITRHVDTPKGVKRFHRLYVYLKFMTKIHRDSIIGGARHHGTSSSEMRIWLNNIAIFKDIDDNQNRLKKIFPYLNNLDLIASNDIAVTDLIHKYGNKVHNRRMFYIYLTATMSYHHIQITQVCRKLGHNPSYLYSRIFNAPLHGLINICQKIAGVTDLDFNGLMNVAKHSGEVELAHHVPVRKIAKTGNSLHISIPYKFHMKPGAKYAVIKRHDGSLLYEPVGVYKAKHPHEH